MKRLLLVGTMSLAGLLPIGCAVQETSPSLRSAAVQHWEYKVINLDETGEKDLTGLLNTQGSNGWEYVGQLTGKDEHLIFRRPVQVWNGGATAAFGPVRTTAVGPFTATGRVIRGETTKVASPPPPAPQQ